jgi:hypothetical protein
MSTISLRLPKNYHKRLQALSDAEGVSINQLITLAIGEKLSAIDTEEYIQKRASLGSRMKFESVLNKIQDIPAEEKDVL